MTPLRVSSSMRLTTAQSGMYWSLNPLTAVGKVAENIKICLSGGKSLINFSITGWKSIESNLSASSRARILQWEKSICFLLAKSKILPGVPNPLKKHSSRISTNYNMDRIVKTDNIFSDRGSSSRNNRFNFQVFSEILDDRWDLKSKLSSWNQD